MTAGIHILGDDHFHDHCGVFGVFGHPEAAKLAYLGIYALQHRGQESAGIASADGSDVHIYKSLGHVQEIFTPEAMQHLPGLAAIAHTRYSTAGDNVLINAQPIVIDCNKGKLALGHNGNLTNALELRRKLEHRGSIFQTTSDTEVIVHLIARSSARNLSGAIADALSQVEGAYSLLLLTRDEMYAIRDPRGFRPLILGRIDGAWVAGSESCAFDLIDAEYVREVEPGEMVRISRAAGVEDPSASRPTSRINIAFSNMFISRARTAWSLAAPSTIAVSCWANCSRANTRSRPTWWRPSPIPACPRQSATRKNPASHSAWR